MYFEHINRTKNDPISHNTWTHAKKMIYLVFYLYAPQKNNSTLDHFSTCFVYRKAQKNIFEACYCLSHCSGHIN